MKNGPQFVAAILVCLGACAFPAHAALTPDEVRQISVDAYLYGHPLVDNYRIYCAFAVDGNNTVTQNEADANSSSIFDSPYRITSLDFRAEPLVVTLPKVGKGRTWELQLIDFYTRNFERLDRIVVPSGGGCVLVVGPQWRGKKPAECVGLLRARSTLALAVGQIRLEAPSDLEAMNQVRPNFKIQPLSAYLGQSPPPRAPTIDYLEPLSADDVATNPEFFNELAFLLPFCPPLPDDAVSRADLAKLGLVPGRPFGSAFMPAGERAALAAGQAEGQRVVANLPPGKSFPQVFGTPSAFGDVPDASVPDLAPLADEGAFEIPFTVDSGGHLLDGSQGRYTLTFAAGQLPPASQAWALSLVSLPDQDEVENPIDRYFISSQMLPDMVRGADGSLTIFIQHDPPSGDQVANWLPAPNGTFMMILRLHNAEEPARDNTWEAPRVDRVD